MNAVWDHAAADGPSMLRLIETVVAALAGRSVPLFSRPMPHHVRRQPMSLGLFALSLNTSLVRAPTEEGLHPPGVAWLTVPVD